MKKIIATILCFILVFAFIGNAMAASGNTVYNRSGTTHRFDTVALAKGSATSWLRGYDDNTSITFTNTSLPKYQRSVIITPTEATMSATADVTTGENQSFSIKASQLTTPHAQLRVRNP